MAFILILFIGGLGVSTWWRKDSSALSSEESLKDFLISKGSSASQIGNNLYRKGFIKSPFAFKIYLQLKGQSKGIQAGEYSLSPSYSLIQIVSELLKGPTEIWVTIPEGLRKEEIARRFSISFGKDSDFEQKFLQESDSFEGKLFPDTYLFPKTASASMVVKKMRDTFEEKVGEKTLKEVVTVASIIERETRSGEERPLVAGILYKRLKAKWPLQVDATLQYAVANSKFQILNSKSFGWWEPLTKEDLEIDSSYNTYKFTGLPPTPIANPGLSSIKAALYPEESAYWFYLHDSKGNIHFAKTIEEHNKNVREFLGK